MVHSLEQIVNLCSDITNNSKEIKKGSLFLALPGQKYDGRNYISEATKNGASAIIYEKKGFKLKEQINIPHLGIENLHKEQAKIIRSFFRNPSKYIRIIGITGTNGKTSVAGWLSQSLNLLNCKTGTIGTLGYQVPGNKSKTLNTTPDIISLSKFLNNTVKEQCKFVVLEVSSHAIQQKRIENIDFDLRILTNVSRDHLDYHKTIKKYQNIKKRFFLSDKRLKAIINVDDLVGREIIYEGELENDQFISYAIDRDADLKVKNIVYKKNKMIFDFLWGKKTYQIKTNIHGKHNIYNLLGVIASLLFYQFPMNKIIEAIENLESISGRNEVAHFDNNGLPQVIIDYAHTPDALENILQSLGETEPSEIILIFGCGGNRDKGKRKKMALVASKYADKVIVTNDNPRDENPRDILNAIEKNLSVNNEVIESRENAIKRGLMLVKKKSILLIAGKGHENFQEIKGVKTPFSDKEVVLSNIGLVKN
jgi:UDP-N-acetylmuramoyl-L-alanyl-D-glutamate--2,6-diaminopimelate ligase